MSFDPDEVQRALRKAWSLSTSSQWTPNNPAAGQCNVTALLVHELFGGELLKTPLPAADHFYNRIEGRRYDFTGASSIGRLPTSTCSRIEPTQSWEQRATNWPNSEPLFCGTVLGRVPISPAASRDC